MNDANTTTALTVPATLDALSLIGQKIKDVTAAAGLEKRAAYNLRLAVDEIATNIVLHGYQEAGIIGDIVVYTEMREDALVITLEDSGVPFDPRSITQPSEEDLALPLEERAIGGLGIFLTINGIDRFDYELVDNHNRNIFEVRRKAA